jgi:hypothetical protein
VPIGTVNVKCPAASVRVCSATLLPTAVTLEPFTGLPFMVTVPERKAVACASAGANDQQSNKKIRQNVGAMPAARREKPTKTSLYE